MFFENFHFLSDFGDHNDFFVFFCTMADSFWRKITYLLYENPGDSKNFEKSQTLKIRNFFFREPILIIF